MSNPVEIARAKIAKMRAEIARLEDFIALYAELSTGSATVKVDASAVRGATPVSIQEGYEASQIQPVDNFSHADKRHHKQRGEHSPTQIAEIILRIIREVGQPMTRGQIVRALEARDIVIPTTDKGKYVGTVAWRHKGLLTNIEGRGYWLTGEAVPPRRGDYQPSIEFDDDVP